MVRHPCEIQRRLIEARNPLFSEFRLGPRYWKYSDRAENRRTCGNTRLLPRHHNPMWISGRQGRPYLCLHFAAFSLTRRTNRGIWTSDLCAPLETTDADLTCDSRPDRSGHEGRAVCIPE